MALTGAVPLQKPMPVSAVEERNCNGSNLYPCAKDADLVGDGSSPGPIMKKILRTAILILAVLGLSVSLNAQNNAPTNLNEMTIAQLQARMAAGTLTSVDLTKFYLARIAALDKNGTDGGVNSIIELNPDALAIAQHADDLRAQGKVLGPLHGIPVLLKDNIDTGDKMQTTAGSFALFGTPATQDSTVAANLRKGGAVILGKTTLSEWANFRSFESTSGWSGRGGQCNNPYALDRNPCGSSSGSGAAASANFAAVSLGSETDGSIVCPGNANGVVGLKPTVGLTSRAGVVPISHTQDTVGPHGRTVADAAATLGVIQSRTFDGRDPATGGVPLGWQGTGKTRPNNIPTDYTQFLDPHGLEGARLGLTFSEIQGFDPFNPTPQPIIDAFNKVVDNLRAAGATVIDLDKAGFTFPNTGNSEFLVISFDFRQDVKNYFSTRVGVPVAGGTLSTAIQFNRAHADVEMPFFNQDIFVFCAALAQGADTPQPLFGGLTYNQALQKDHNGGVNGIDKALKKFNLDAVVSVTDNPAWETDLIYSDTGRFYFASSGLAAPPGYPIIQVPAAMVFGTPMGVSFLGTAFSEPTLIKVASGFEAFTQVRAHNLPQFLDNTPSHHIQGATPVQDTNTVNPANANRKPQGL
jgi:amidase